MDVERAARQDDGETQPDRLRVNFGLGKQVVVEDPAIAKMAQRTVQFGAIAAATAALANVLSILANPKFQVQHTFEVRHKTAAFRETRESAQRYARPFSPAAPLSHLHSLRTDPPSRHCCIPSFLRQRG